MIKKTVDDYLAMIRTDRKNMYGVIKSRIENADHRIRYVVLMSSLDAYPPEWYDYDIDKHNPNLSSVSRLAQNRHTLDHWLKDRKIQATVLVPGPPAELGFLNDGAIMHFRLAL